MEYLKSNLQMEIHLGGEDFDDTIVEYLVNEFKKDNGIDLKSDKLALQRLKSLQRKQKLSSLLRHKQK